MKAYSYLDPSDENHWREKRFIVYTDLEPEVVGERTERLRSVWG